MVASWDGRVSCGKCVLDAYFFRYHKSITIKVSWAGQDLTCSPETVEGILRPGKRRWAVLNLVQLLDKYIWKSASQVALFAYSPICETLHTKSIVRPVKGDWAVLSKDTPLDISI